MDWLARVQALLPGARLELVDELGGSTRSHVRRVRADHRTLIVKEFVASGDGWARESAALSVIPAEARVPRLVASGSTPPIVVMSDLGPGISVADALLGTDGADAADAVTAWATTIALLHRTTAGLRQPFQEALASRSADLPAPESTIAADLQDAARAIAAHGSDLGVEVPAAALDELRSLECRLGGAGPAALTPADACPDNNVRTGGGLTLIDFEGAQWRHVAWDVAYLTVPWPSCWCSWRLPDDVAQRAIDAYRAASTPGYVGSPAFRRDLQVAATGWAFLSASWFLPRALADDAPLTMPSPTRRAMIMHRLGLARASTELPALAGLAVSLHDALTERWGEVPLGFAPAFRR
jgi:hypothetical protein